MKIIWTERASEAAEKVANYILAEFGYRIYLRFWEILDKETSLIIEMPMIGKIEPTLEDSPKSYRSLVINKRSKIIYRIDGETIYVVDFWDTRREPKKLAKGL